MRKTRAQLRDEGYERLGVTPEQVGAVRPLSLLVRKFGGRKSEAIGLLRSSEDSAARAFLEVYDDAPAASRKQLPLEAFCVAAGIPPRRLWEIIAGEKFERDAMVCAAIVGTNLPEIVEKTVEFAKKPGRWRDRMALLEATGFLPTPSRGSQTMVTVQAEHNEWPPLRRRSNPDRFNDRGRSALPPVPDAKETL